MEGIENTKVAYQSGKSADLHWKIQALAPQLKKLEKRYACASDVHARMGDLINEFKMHAAFVRAGVIQDRTWKRLTLGGERITYPTRKTIIAQGKDSKSRVAYYDKMKLALKLLRQMQSEIPLLPIARRRMRSWLEAYQPRLKDIKHEGPVRMSIPLASLKKSSKVVEVIMRNERHEPVGSVIMLKTDLLGKLQECFRQALRDNYKQQESQDKLILAEQYVAYYQHVKQRIDQQRAQKAFMSIGKYDIYSISYSEVEPRETINRHPRSLADIIQIVHGEINGS